MIRINQENGEDITLELLAKNYITLINSIRDRIVAMEIKRGPKSESDRAKLYCLRGILNDINIDYEQDVEQKVQEYRDAEKIDTDGSTLDALGALWFRHQVDDEILRDIYIVSIKNKEGHSSE